MHRNIATDFIPMFEMLAIYVTEVGDVGIDTIAMFGWSVLQV
jgi:hypothetical protein